MSKLRLADDQIQMLKELRKLVRTRTKEVFEELKKLAQTRTFTAASVDGLKAEIANTRLRHLSPEARDEIALLI